MSIMDIAAWSLIGGLSLISVGGLLIWAYGDSLQVRQPGGGRTAVAARMNFMGVLIYSVVMIIVGMALLLHGTFFLLNSH
ncbi:MAG: hypothetical protein HY053_02445 [Proteobacteria bacterium]|nr:hypothetical protein [Pseudomonadota bacterium]